MRLDKRSLSRYGYVRFSCDSRFQSTLNIASSLGNILDLPGVPTVQTIKPSQTDAKEASSYSGNYGMSAFPLHTDMAHWYVPPPYLLLRCVKPAEQVFTTIISARNIVASEGAETYRKALFRPRRRLDGRLSVLRLYDRGIFRWDNLFILPINERATELQSRIAERVENENVISVCYESATDCILIDNWNAIHGRSAVPEFASDRVLERVFLSRING
mgnify:FL=1